MRLLKQSSTAQPLVFLLVLASDHITGATGLSPTVTLRKSNASAAGSFGSPAGTVREIGNGWYQVDGNATDTNTLGPLILHATGTGTDPLDLDYDVVAFDPQDSVRMGQTALPNAAAGANGGLPTGDASGRVDVGKALGTAVTLDANNVLNVSTKYLGGTLQTARDIGLSVLLSSGTGTGQLDFTAGVVKANATQWLGGTIPSVNTTGVPKVDAVLWLGVAPLALSSQQVQAVVPTTQKVDVETIKTRAVSAAGAVVVGGFVGQDTAAIGVNASGHVSRVTLADTLTTYTGNTPQTGDAFARIGLAGAGLTALGDTRLANLDAAVSDVPDAVDTTLSDTHGSGAWGASITLDGTPPATIRPTDTWRFTVTVRDAAGVHADLDGGATIVVQKNGSTVTPSPAATLTNVTTGIYNFAMAASAVSAADADSLSARISGTVGGVAVSGVWNVAVQLVAAAFTFVGESIVGQDLG